jgi:hypothetical protein
MQALYRFQGAVERVLRRKNGRKSGLPEIRGGQWKLVLGSAETAALFMFLYG